MKEVEIKELQPHMRNDEFFDDISGEKWTEFLESIKKNGVIEPVIISQDKVIVSGHQRVRACKELGIDKVPCEIRQYENEDDILLELLETNLRRRGEIGGSSKKQGKRFRELERLYGIQHGGDRRSNKSNLQTADLMNSETSKITQAELAAKHGVSVDTWNRAKKLADIPQELDKMLIKGQMNKNAALMIVSKLPEEEQIKLIQQLDGTKKYTEKIISGYIDTIKRLQAQSTNFIDIGSIGSDNREKKLEAENAYLKEELAKSTDYNLIESLKSQITSLESELSQQKQQKQNLESIAKLTEEESLRLQKIQNDIRNITQQKESLGKKMRSVKELAELVYEVQETLEKQLAPIKFKRCMDVLDRDEVVLESLKEIVSKVENWTAEMNTFLHEDCIVGEIIE